ncbi:MAG TPA: hypothetical protein VKV18_05990 [Chthonomonas sp.]|jgi:hypothetical protein|uniref:hypothetical protein n=1 Tax=Chthonomonas sp. TaxID=2282153 RepID=UPI002B4B5F77|nr:hypothetical protein [Chthonomonas sp.]HLH79583.1 hypothetical protein [Chthonomonas sp.]HLI48226.1 hypothetical protein [Chthonomonas sp.]
MPQFEQLKKGMTRVRVPAKDSLRAYLLLMQRTGGKMQVLPNDVYVLDESQIQILKENQIPYEVIADK